MKKDNPIRTSQLIRPFGAGSLYVTKDGVGLIACGLDHWYKSFNGATRLQNELTEFLIYEWRLQKQLNVSHFRAPPEFREKDFYLGINKLKGFSEYGTIENSINIPSKWFLKERGLSFNNFNVIKDIYDYKVLITYNGKLFDIPFIENFFNVELNHAQIDLRYILKSLGYVGGLKSCEKQLGLNRYDLDGIDGSMAIQLWHDYYYNSNLYARLISIVYEPRSSFSMPRFYHHMLVRRLLRQNESQAYRVTE